MISEDHPDVMRQEHQEPVAARTAVLRQACEVTRAVIAPAADVSVTLVDRDPPRTVASTGPLATTADGAQYAAGDGPCLAAARSGAPVLVPDIGVETRWPRYVPVAARAGVGSSLSVPLQVADRPVGALNVYATDPRAFDEAAVELARDLGQLVAVVLTSLDDLRRSADLAEQLQQAMQSRAVIEQAKGIVMAQGHCSPDEAFAALVRLSQESHRKLREVAQMLVDQVVAG